jgi:5-methylcytosine-specific restriction endonuclease McrA
MIPLRNRSESKRNTSPVPQIFRSRPKSAAKIVRPQEPNSTARGYDAKWRRYSERFRRKNPFCARCLEAGRMTLVVIGRTGVVDHKWPVSDGGPFWDPTNHWSLCSSCHGWKAQLENHWREIGAPGAEIIRWCDDPASRPRFRGDIVG